MNLIIYLGWKDFFRSLGKTSKSNATSNAMKNSLFSKIVKKRVVAFELTSFWKIFLFVSLGPNLYYKTFSYKLYQSEEVVHYFTNDNSQKEFMKPTLFIYLFIPSTTTTSLKILNIL